MNLISESLWATSKEQSQDLLREKWDLNDSLFSVASHFNDSFPSLDEREDSAFCLLTPVSSCSLNLTDGSRCSRSSVWAWIWKAREWNMSVTPSCLLTILFCCLVSSTHSSIFSSVGEYTRNSHYYDRHDLMRFHSLSLSLSLCLPISLRPGRVLQVKHAAKTHNSSFLLSFDEFIFRHVCQMFCLSF